MHCRRVHGKRILKLITGLFITCIVVHIQLSKKSYVKNIRIDRILQFNVFDNKPPCSLASDAEYTDTYRNYLKIRNPQLVLLWNGRNKWLNKTSYKKCRYKNCKFITDRNYFNQSSAVIYYSSAMSHDDFDIPPRKLPDQVWIHMSNEPPYLQPSLRKFSDLVNWTVGYRRDSDIAVPSVKMVPFKQYLDINSFDATSQKTKIAAWIANTCETESKREIYVDKIRRYFNIDTFGKCGDSNCTSHGKSDGVECGDQFSQTYSFYFSFEKALCRDYMTRGLTDVLGASVIPVIRGGYRTDMYLPVSSNVDVSNFQSVQGLVEHLRTLLKNKSKYMSYFHWKNHYSVTEPCADAILCEICRRLQRPNDHVRLYSDLDKWVHGEGHHVQMCNTNPRDFISK